MNRILNKILPPNKSTGDEAGLAKVEDWHAFDPSRLKKRRTALILMILIPFVLFVIIILLITRPKQEKTPVITSQPTLMPSPTPTIPMTPSKWATSSAILDLDTRLMELNNRIDSTDLKEIPLLPPALDLEVKF